MRDDTIKVEISKKDLTTMEELPGAELTLTDKDGKEIDRWVSSDKPHYIEKLPAGEYTLTEITAPDGYDIAESIRFTVLPTGEVQTVVMKDARTPERTPQPEETPHPTETPQPDPQHHACADSCTAANYSADRRYLPAGVAADRSWYFACRAGGIDFQVCPQQSCHRARL